MKIHYTILLLLITVSGKAQNDGNQFKKNISITISSGISFYSIIDKNISNEKYSGTLIPFNFICSSNITDKQSRDFYFSFQTGTINNFKVDALINELTLGWDYGFKLNNKKGYDILLGPAPFLYFYDRQQEISSKYYANSNLGMITLACVFGIKSNKLNGFNYKLKGRLGLLSAGVSPKDENKTKILTPLNGFQFHFSVLVSYKLLNWADIAFEYSFQTYNIVAWNKMYSLSDQLALNIIFSF